MIHVRLLPPTIEVRHEGERSSPELSVPIGWAFYFSLWTWVTQRLRKLSKN